jgi:hypothetical protein
VWFTILTLALNSGNERMADKNVVTNSISNMPCLPDVIRGTQCVERRCTIVGCDGRTACGPHSLLNMWICVVELGCVALCVVGGS